MEEKKTIQQEVKKPTSARFTVPIEDEKSLSPLLVETESETEGETGDLFESVFKDLEDLEERKKKVPLPAFYRETRAAVLTTSQIWEAFISRATELYPEEAAQISELDFRAFDAAIKKILYNTSKYFNNEKTNEGIRRGWEEVGENGEVRFQPTLVVPLSDLCKEGYGTDNPDTKQKKRISTLIDLLHKTHIRYEDKYYEAETALCFTKAKVRRKRDNAVVYGLELNRIYCNNIRVYSQKPQDHIKKLRNSVKQITSSLWRLDDLLAAQNKNLPLTRTIGQLVKDMGVEEEYEKDRGRTEKKILNNIEAEIRTGVLQSYEVMKDGKGKYIEKVKFHYQKDPNYGWGKRKKQEPEEQ